MTRMGQLLSLGSAAARYRMTAHRELRVCCCGGCSCGYRAKRCLLALTRAGHRRVPSAFRRESSEGTNEGWFEPGSGGLCVRNAPHGALSLGVPRASPGVPDADTDRACPRRDSSKSAARRSVSGSSLFFRTTATTARSPSLARGRAFGTRAVPTRAPAGLRGRAGSNGGSRLRHGTRRRPRLALPGRSLRGRRAAARHQPRRAASARG
jgi:hypothetical protein